jgi:hypothetical protein
MAMEEFIIDVAARIDVLEQRLMAVEQWIHTVVVEGKC